MKFLSVLFLVLFLIDAVFDCYWAGLLDRLQGGKITKENLTGLRARLAACRYRYSKFLLMPLLIFFYLLASVSRFPVQTAPAASVLVLIALFCGWVGDTALELGDRSFLIGVGAFLVGHVFYMIRFAQPVDFSSLSPLTFLILIPIALYLVFALKNILPAKSARKLLPALILYLLTLIGLGCFAFFRYECAPAPSFIITLIGAISFIASDTILAFHLFLSRSGVLVMPTYVLAQFLITLGMLLSGGY